MSSSQPQPTRAERAAQLRARWEAVATVRAQELAALTDEQARRVIETLGVTEAWRARPDWSGLVEQQTYFARLRRR